MGVKNMSMLKALFVGLCVVLIASQIEGCADKRRDCILWKYLGKCNGSLKGAMEIVCRKTCGHCDAPCVDKNANCPVYKKLNYCGNQKFKAWLQLNLASHVDSVLLPQL